MSKESVFSDTFSKSSIPIIGYGLYRNTIDSPWFIGKDYADAVPESSFKKMLLPSPSGFTNIRQHMVELGYMELDQITGLGGRPRAAMRVLETAKGPFIDYLLQKVTHSGATLPEQLLIPESIDSILQNTDFLQRLVTQVSGRAIQASFDSLTS